jgi:hypothetical protein
MVHPRRPGGPADADMVARHMLGVLGVAGEGQRLRRRHHPPPDLAGADRYPRRCSVIVA